MSNGRDGTKSKPQPLYGSGSTREKAKQYCFNGLFFTLRSQLVAGVSLWGKVAIFHGTDSS